MSESEGALVLCRGEVNHPGVVADVAGQGVPLDVRPVLPLGRVWGARACDPKVVMFDLILKGKSFVYHYLL